MNKKGEMNTKVLIVILSILVVVIGIFAYSLFFKKADIIVPDFRKMSESEILDWAKENECEDKLVIKYEYNEEIPKGEVVYQTINPESKLEDIITVTISNGSNPNVYIDIVYDENTTIDELKNWFQELGFSNVTYQYEINKDYESGQIIGVEPASCKKSDLVIVKVASNNVIKVLDFSNYTKNKIDIWAKENSVEVYYSYESSKLDKDKVVSQTPKAGETINEGEKLTIVLSSGNANTNTIPNNLLGIAETDFIAKLKELGFNNLKKDSETYFSALSKKGTIFSYDDGTFPLTQTINYAISEGKYPDSFDAKEYVGKTLQEANKVVEAYNKRNAHITLTSKEFENNDVKEGTLYDCEISFEKPNSTIACKLSKKQNGGSSSDNKYATLPENYLGKTESDFINSCKVLGFEKITKTQNHYSTTIDKDRVAYYDPDGYLSLTTTIEYALSSGPYWDNFNKNDYNNKTLADAKSVASKYNELNAHIVFSTTEVVNNNYETGTVYDCSISHENTTSYVSCKLAKNSTTPENPSDKKATLPNNLLGYSEENFITTCKALGFTYLEKGNPHFSTTNKINTIAYYDPDGELPINTKIVYGLSLGSYYDSFNANDYVGKTLSQANSVVANYNSINAHITLKYAETETNSVESGTLYDCSVSHNGSNTIVSCKLAKASSTPVNPPSDNTAYLLSSKMIAGNYSTSSYNDTLNGLKDYFNRSGFNNITYKAVSSAKTVGQIISVTMNGSSFKEGNYDKNTAIVVEICNKTEN